MNIKVTKDNVCILNKESVHEGEYKINELSFEFSEEYTSDLVINAVFTNELGKAYQVSVIDNKCHIPAEILADTGQVLLGVYAYRVNNDNLELRYSPFPTSFNVISGSYDPTAEESQEITSTQFEQYMQALQNGLNQVKDSISELNQATDNANDLVDEINKKLENGEFIGPQGPQGIQGPVGPVGPQGPKGDPGEVTEETLDNIVPKQTATDSIINVNDALKYKIFDFKVDGAYKQKTYQGKNLANFSSLYCPILTGSLENQEATINGTTEQNTNVTLEFKEENVNLKANQPYTISVICSGTVTGGTYKKLYLSFNENDSIEIGDYSSNHTTTYTFTPDTDMQVRSINMDISLGQTFNNLKVKVQIEKGSTATDYEPYVGGVAVPNPNQPSEITTLNFDMITRRGKNLSDYQETNYQIDLQGNEMVALPNGVKDELQIDKEGNINLIKDIDKVILNGVDDFWWADDGNNGFFTNKLQDKCASQYLLNDHFTCSNSYDTWTGVGKFGIGLSGNLWFMPTNQSMTLEDWIAWLKENNLATYYQTKEPQIISLGKLENLITTENGSNTFAINGNIDTNISTTYALDLKKYIDNKIATVSTAVIGE